MARRRQFGSPKPPGDGGFDPEGEGEPAAKEDVKWSVPLGAVIAIGAILVLVPVVFATK